MKKKVLIAEDDEGILDILKIILEMHEYNVDIVRGGKIIKDMQNKLPDLLLLDVWLGKTDGRKICQILKKQASTKNIPIILISATTNLAQSMKDSGADDYLEKPFEMNDLLAKVEKYTKKS